MIGIGAHSKNHGSGTPDEVLGFIHKLDYEYVDVTSDTFSVERAVENPKAAAEESRALLEKYELNPSEYLPGPVKIDGKSYMPSMLESAMLNKACSYFDKVCSYAKKAGFTSIKGGAGDTLPELGYEKIRERTIKVLPRLVQVALDNGLAYNIEPSQHSEMFNTPQKALSMAEAVPGLTFTLDMLHYVSKGFSTDECLRLLLKYTNHVHARQSAHGYGKCPYEFGEVDYDMMIKRMRGMRWSGVLAIEWWVSEARENERGRPRRSYAI